MVGGPRTKLTNQLDLCGLVILWFIRSLSFVIALLPNGQNLICPHLRWYQMVNILFAPFVPICYQKTLFPQGKQSPPCEENDIFFQQHKVIINEQVVVTALLYSCVTIIDSRPAYNDIDQRHAFQSLKYNPGY